jgi:hypothetical protein
MSLTQDPKQIADWLIKRAGSDATARPYIETLRSAQGLLLTPGASGVDAVKVAADLKAQGIALRAKMPLPESTAKNVVAEVKPAAPAAAADAAPPPLPDGWVEEKAPSGGPQWKDRKGVVVFERPTTPSSGGTRKSRHHTPKHKKLSRKRSIKRK